MFSVVLGIAPPPGPELFSWENNEVKSIDDVPVEWRGESVVEQQVEGEGTTTPTLLVSGLSEAPVTCQAIVAAVEDALRASAARKEQDLSYEVELWVSAPAPLPLRPPCGYATILERQNNDDDWDCWASTILREWGLVVQRNVLEDSAVAALRLEVDKAIQEANLSLEQYHPDIRVGSDNFIFREIASRGAERFDLRIPMDTKAGALVNDHVRNHPQIQAFLNQILGSFDEIDCDISVVYSRPGASWQGWHSDGDHQRGALDAGWCKDGWKQRLAPTYALCLFIPLVDLNDAVGFTQFWPASHRSRDLIGFGKVAELTEATMDGKCNAGDGIWYDYRLFHRGMPNRSENIVRPVVQLLFKKKWYQERANYGVKAIRDV